MTGLGLEVGCNYLVTRYVEFRIMKDINLLSE